jgi:two-component system sensor histidine kinase/response regulator
LRVLLAEDNFVNQRLATRMLEKHGHEVVVVNSGKEALAALDRQRFDLVLMDVQMPEMGGLEAASAIRRREAAPGAAATGHRRIPVIAMTAHAMKGDRERCLEAGMDGYVSKPIRAEELFEAIARVVPAHGDAPSEARPLPPPSPAEEFDRAELMDRVEGDLGLLDSLVRVFLDSYPAMLAAVKMAVDRRDAGALHCAAHELKGAVANFACPDAVQAALRLEVMGRSEDLSGAEGAFAELKGALERLRPALGRLLQNGDKT